MSWILHLVLLRIIRRVIGSRMHLSRMRVIPGFPVTVSRARPAAGILFFVHTRNNGHQGLPELAVLALAPRGRYDLLPKIP